MDNLEIIIPVALTIITAATPLLFAALGELVVEKSGVLNLGVEGMMLMGAMSAFVATYSTGSAFLGIIAGAAAAALTSLLFAFLILHLRANQVATGLALTLFCIGLSALLGAPFVGKPIESLVIIEVPLLSEIPIIGTLLFKQDVLVYLSIFSTIAVGWFLYRSRPGLVLRAVGESHDVAHSLGYSVVKIRYAAIAFGGAMAGLAGSYLSLAYTPMWVENMAAGRGWIALALVVFATWRPLRVLLGAYLFGGVTILQLHTQALGLDVPSQALSMLPYLATILVLVLVSLNPSLIRLNAPASIGKVFHRTA